MNMRTTVALVAVFLVVTALGIWYVSRTSVELEPSTVTSAEEGVTPIKLYFYNPSLDQGIGRVQCSEDGLVEVLREIPKTETPLKDSIELLLRGELSDEERRQGITTEFPLSGFSLTIATINNGVATLTFDDSQHKTVGGSCRTAILWAQIRATAEQFPAVTSVRFMPEDLFQP